MGQCIAGFVEDVSQYNLSRGALSRHTNLDTVITADGTVVSSVNAAVPIDFNAFVSFLFAACCCCCCLLAGAAPPGRRFHLFSHGQSLASTRGNATFTLRGDSTKQ